MEEMMEKKAQEGGREAQQSADRERRMATKQRFAVMPESIVFIPAGGREGFAFYRQLLDLNRHVRKINNNAVFGEIGEVKSKHNEIKKLCGEAWEGLKDIAPRFHAFDPKHWREFNETIEEKSRLIHRIAACVVNPIDDNVAMITMAVKILSEKFNEYQAKSDFDSMEKVARLFQTIRSRITEITGSNGDAKTSETAKATGSNT
jgi:hypothetical protein